MNYINETEMLQTIEKINMYIRDEKLAFQNIKSLLNDVNCYYQDSNKMALEEIVLDIDNKLKNIDTIHEEYMMVLQLNINKYNELKNATAQEFNMINEEE